MAQVLRASPKRLATSDQPDSDSIDSDCESLESGAVPRDALTAAQQRVLRDFGYRVQSLRVEKGLTQMALAHEAGLHPTYIGQVENGRRNVALLNVHALATALGVTASDLLG